MTQVLAPWEIELAQAFRVSFEDDHRTTILKQFLFQNLKADIDLPVLVERFKRDIINGAVYVDSWDSMTTVVFVINPPDYRNTFIRFLSVNNAKLVTLFETIDEMKLKTAKFVAGEPCSTDHLYSIFSKSGINVRRLATTFVYTLEDSNVSDNVLPDGYKIKKIKDEDFDFIGSSWPFASNRGEGNFFKYIGQKYRSSAIYKEDEVVSWVFESSIGNFLHLFTVPEHRGKGLAAIVIKDMCKKMFAKGQKPYSFIVCGNESSEKVFLRIGFKRLETPRQYIAFNC